SSRRAIRRTRVASHPIPSSRGSWARPEAARTSPLVAVPAAAPAGAAPAPPSPGSRTAQPAARSCPRGSPAAAARAPAVRPPRRCRPRHWSPRPPDAAAAWRQAPRSPRNRCACGASASFAATPGRLLADEGERHVGLDDGVVAVLAGKPQAGEIGGGQLGLRTVQDRAELFPGRLDLDRQRLGDEIRLLVAVPGERGLARRHPVDAERLQGAGGVLETLRV